MYWSNSVKETFFCIFVCFSREIMQNIIREKDWLLQSVSAFIKQTLSDPGHITQCLL